MKIKIGPYVNWFGPYQLAKMLHYVGVSKDRCHAIGERLADTWIGNVLNWIHKKRRRKITIHIDKYDTWNMNDTLALIIVPMLKQLRATTHGSPLVDDLDVPVRLRSHQAPPKQNEYDTDQNHHLRWEWILDEMIWTFEQFNVDWESQYYSGTHDISFVETDQTIFNPFSNKQEKTYEMVTGPNDTFAVDEDGLQQHQQRIANGLRLFGKYYSNLWD